jgi:hypothetical protein
MVLINCLKGFANPSLTPNWKSLGGRFYYFLLCILLSLLPLLLALAYQGKDILCLDSFIEIIIVA